MPPVSASSSNLQRFDPRLLATLGSLDLRARYLVEGYLSGLHESPFHGFSVEFSEYREYEPGDDPRHVDWRVFARSERLYIKQFMQETNLQAYVLCDTSRSMEYGGSAAWGSKLEVARCLAAALAWLLIKQNDAVGWLAFTNQDPTPDLVRPSQRPSQYGTLLRHLGQVQPRVDACLAPLLLHASRLIQRRSLLIVISDLLEPAAELTRALQELRFRGQDLLVLQVLDRDELDFPFREDQVFEDLETGVRRRVSPDAVREQYRKRFQAFMQAHIDQLRDLEIQHALVTTDTAPWQAISTVLQERRRLV